MQLIQVINDQKYLSSAFQTFYRETTTTELKVSWLLFTALSEILRCHWAFSNTFSTSDSIIPEINFASPDFHGIPTHNVIQQEQFLFLFLLLNNFFLFYFLFMFLIIKSWL